MRIHLNQQRTDVIIKDTHRGLLYEDGRLIRVLEAGRFERPKPVLRDMFKRLPQIEVELVDMRERDLTIKGQEILTSDKVAIRVSILVQFKVNEDAEVTDDADDASESE